MNGGDVALDDDLTSEKHIEDVEDADLSPSLVSNSEIDAALRTYRLQLRQGRAARMGDGHALLQSPELILGILDAVFRLLDGLKVREQLAAKRWEGVGRQTPDWLAVAPFRLVDRC